jgi:hypothetical protein
LTEALLELAIEKLNRKCSYTTRTCPRPPDQIGRRHGSDSWKIAFFSRKSVIGGNGEERFEIDDFGILSLANLPVSPSLKRPLWNQRVKASFGNRRQQFTVSTYEPRIDSPSIKPTVLH